MFAATPGRVARARAGSSPLAAATAAMLVCDAWFDIVTSTPGERLEAVLQAVLAELPLAVICGFVVYDVERAQASVRGYGAA